MKKITKKHPLLYLFYFPLTQITKIGRLCNTYIRIENIEYQNKYFNPLYFHNHISICLKEPINQKKEKELKLMVLQKE